MSRAMDNVEFLARVKRIAIIAMFSDDDLMNRLVLKGGNLLDMVYSLSARASKDVDFSIDGDFISEEWLFNKVSHVLRITFAEAGFVAFDIRVRAVPPQISEDMKAFWGGYKVEFKLIDQKRFDELAGNMEKLRRCAAAVGRRGSTVFCIDISKHEYCGEKQPHSIDGFQVFGYSHEMLVCEKIRAICQQMPEYIRVVGGRPASRARDFIDIYVVSEQRELDFGSSQFHNV